MSTHVFSNGDVMNEHLPAGTVTLPEMFKAKGFTTADIGKLFHRIDYAEKQMASFDRIEFYEKPAGWNGPGPILSFPPPPQRGRRRGAKNLTPQEKRQRQRQNSDRYGDSGLAPEQERDYQMAATAAALLEEFAQEQEAFLPRRVAVAAAHAAGRAQEVYRHVRPGHDPHARGPARDASSTCPRITSSGRTATTPTSSCSSSRRPSRPARRSPRTTRASASSTTTWA